MKRLDIYVFFIRSLNFSKQNEIYGKGYEKLSGIGNLLLVPAAAAALKADCEIS